VDIEHKTDTLRCVSASRGWILMKFYGVLESGDSDFGGYQF